MTARMPGGPHRQWKVPWLSRAWFTAWAVARQRTTNCTALAVVEEIIDWVLDGPEVARKHPELHPEGYMRKTWCLELRADNLDPKFNETVTQHFLDAAGKLDAVVNLGSNNEERMMVDMRVWTEDMIQGVVDIRKRWLAEQAAKGAAEITDSDFAALHTDEK